MALRRFYDLSTIFGAGSGTVVGGTASSAGLDALATGGDVAGSGITVSRSSASNIIASGVRGVTAFDAAGNVVSATPAAGGGSTTAASSARARPSSSEILESISTGLGSLKTLTEGLNAKDAANVEADFLELQARQEQIARFREQRDLDKERNRFLARSRAALAAQGADTTSGSAGAILTSQRQEFAEQGRRLLDDSIVREKTLRAKSTNTRQAGKAALRSAIFGAGGQAISGLGSLLK